MNVARQRDGAAGLVVDDVADLAVHLFGEIISTMPVLWHFVNVKCKTFNRRLYFGDLIVEAVNTTPSFPGEYRVAVDGGFFVFLCGESIDSAVGVAESFKCAVEIKGCSSQSHIVASRLFRCAITWWLTIVGASIETLSSLRIWLLFMNKFVLSFRFCLSCHCVPMDFTSLTVVIMLVMSWLIIDRT